MKEHFLKKYSYKQKTVLLIIAFAILRGIIAFTTALGVDESYYWSYTNFLKWNYFDHPPMVAIFIRLTTFNLALDSIEGFVRLGSVLGCALSSWFLYKTCEILHSEKAGFFSACLYNVSFYAAITSGLFIMPDSPQMVFFTLSLWLLAQITIADKDWLNWILFGVAAGLCIMSKVHGVFLWVGLGLYILVNERSWLKLPQLYTALIISLIISSPILIWNIQNDFVTYKFHSNRVVINDSPLNIISFLGEVVSQFLYNNPFNVILIIIAVYTYRKRKQLRSKALGIYNLIAVPLALLLLLIALFRDTTLPHWSGPAYVALLPSAAIYLATAQNVSGLRLLTGSVITFLFILFVGKVALHFYPNEFGEELPQETSASHSGFNFNSLLHVFDGFGRMQLVTEPLTGWSEAINQFDSIYIADVKTGITTDRSPLVCSKWQAAQVDYYFCGKGNKQMIGLGDLNNLHEYLWMNAKRKGDVDLSSAYFVSSEIVDANNVFKPYYDRIDSISTISIDRGYRPNLTFYIYRLTSCKNSLPVME
ncbi:MAG TPA: glycosyltransferase family 39 protein [Segetibacter sp.]